MYQTVTADEWRQDFGLPHDYTVDGLLIFGTYQQYPYDLLRDSLGRLNKKAVFTRPTDEFLEPIQEFVVDGRRYWFVVAYGGALLSEYLHLACLFGSKANILLGSCGGLKRGAVMRELVIPDWSYAEESSAKSYQPDAHNRYSADVNLSKELAAALSATYTIHRGSTVTHQAMLGESWEDVLEWSDAGYIGVEMEAATVFATSNHFKVPSAAVLYIADNLIEQETILDPVMDSSRALRRQTAGDMFDAALGSLLR